MIDLNKILIEDFINPPVKTSKNLSASFIRHFKKKDARIILDNLQEDLREKARKFYVIKSFLKTEAWQEILRPKIIEALQENLGRLLLKGHIMEEKELRAIIVEMRANLSYITDMKRIIAEGEEASFKLEEMENKK